MCYRTQAEIDLDAIEYNYNSVRKKVGNDVKILGVIKADAYGHGAVEVGKLLDGKCDFFGVACIEEALELKKAGINAPVLVLGYVFPDVYESVVKYDIRIPVFSYESALELSKEAKKQNKTVPFHFCVDTGMSRIGFQVSEDSADECKKISQLENIYPEGIFTHFATADEADLTKALAQRERFKAFIKMLENRGIDIEIKHINNSAGIMNFDEYFDMCRMGIVTYGLYPSEEVDKSLLSIKPAMKWTACITHVKNLEPDREISYGGTFKTENTRNIATVPVGYADGYPRCLSNRGRVIVNSQYAPIVGRVCMDQFMIDVTGIDNVSVGTKVTLIGFDGEASLSMEEVSELAYSFNYELPCRISRRVDRVYIRNSKVVKKVNYLG